MIKYRPEIDGLRTIAVLPVILFHLGYGFIKGGYMGVDVFFVISGYLITRILVDDIEHSRFSMYRFWIRRVKRLIPLLLTVVLCTLLIIPFFIFKPVVKDVSKDIFPAIFSYFNFHALFDFGNYWGGSSENSFFLHTWSLSVEEQFYLLYPFFLFFVHKFFKNFLIPVFTITIASAILFFFFLHKANEHTDIAFYMLHTRIWELSIGGLAGLISIKNTDSPVKNNMLVMLGVSFIFFSYFFGGKNINYSVVFPVIGAAMVILFCTPNDVIGKALSSKIMVNIGKISYSLYLWHWVIILFFKNLSYQFGHINHLVINMVIVFLTFLFSYLSYRFIENKTRNYKHTPKIVIAGLMLITGLVFYYKSNEYSPFYSSKYKRQVAHLAYFDISPTQKKLQDFLSKDNITYNVDLPNRLPKFQDSYKKDGIILNEANGKPGIMLIGDSHGVMWAKLLNEISDESKTTLSCYTSNGTKPFFNVSNLDAQPDNGVYNIEQRVSYAKSIIENIKKWKPKLIVLACAWTGVSEEQKKQMNDLLVFLEKRNINVLIFTQPPVLNFMPDKNADQYFTYLKINPTTGYNSIHIKNDRVIQKNDEIKSLASKYSNVTIYDVFENMLIDGKVKISLGYDVLYFDDDHLSYAGTSIHKDQIALMMANLLK